jgi:hypothetical protein
MSVAGLGNTSNVTRIRDGVASDVAIELVAAPDDPPRDALILDQDAILPGLQLARVNPAVINELNLQLNAIGVVVTSPGPYGARVGLKAGDIIEQVRGKAINAPFDVEKTLASGGRNVSIRVLRGDGRVQLRFRL